MEYPDHSHDMWEEFKVHFAEQYLHEIRSMDPSTDEYKIAINDTLYDLNRRLSAHGKSNKDFRIPMPLHELKISRLRENETKYFKNKAFWKQFSERNQDRMYKAQKEAFDAIIGEFENANRNYGYFAFLDETSLFDTRYIHTFELHT